MNAILLTVLLGLCCQVAVPVVIRVENLPEKCDFSRCTAPDPAKLNVHLVPHTHDDVGWLKTVDQYYYGSNSVHQKAGVQFILDSVVEELIRDKDRRFIYVETAFFWKWWLEQNEDQRSIVRELVRSGQLEFINGGWSMNDEATCHYNSIIDQMTWGLRRLNDTFGRCGVPRVAWQIDPFGHSREHANLIAQMNFDAMFFAREDYQDHERRYQDKTMEHVWQASDDLGVAGDLFTGMMHMGYGPPENFNWDLSSDRMNNPIVDNPNSEEYNVPEMVRTLVNLAKDYAKGYRTNQIMFPMGTDFQYQDAHYYFKNMDKLIRAVNANSSDVKVFYSTPSCYAKSVNEAPQKVVWTSKVDDYFPYASDPHAYWTGYFTSRPALKRFEREGNNLLQACKQVDALGANREKFQEQVDQLREMMGVMQHHDAVTGTEKQHVAQNYAKHLETAITDCLKVIDQTLQSRLLPTDPKVPAPALKYSYCRKLNESSCATTESGEDFAVQLYNPLGHEVKDYQVRLPVQVSDALFYSVAGPDAAEVIPSALVPISEGVRKIPLKVSRATHELVFRAQLPALGSVTFFVTASKTKSAQSAPVVVAAKIAAAETVLKSKNFDVHFDAKGELASLTLKDGRSVPLKSDFRFYHSEDEVGERASGAYIFRPLTNSKLQLIGELAASELVLNQEAGVEEVHQKIGAYISQVIRVDPTQDAIEFDWIVGPIPVDDNVAKEVVHRFSAPTLASNRTFYTDANGRQMLKRIWNYRPTWKYSVQEPISGNYYPINSRIYLRDEKQDLQLTVLNDRSQGGTSQEDGQVELMVHRRLLYDDGFGVSEELNEPGLDGPTGPGLVVRGRHLLQLSSISASAALHRPKAQQLFMQPLLSFITGISAAEYRKQFQTRISGLASALPAQVHLLTLEQWRDSQILIRLEHFYQKGEDAELSKPATVGLKNLLKGFEVTQAKELTLAANQDISALEKRLKFPYTPIGTVAETPETKLDPTKLEVTLSPMQIRTFVLKVVPKP